MNYQQMSYQDLFDTSYNHIIKQGCPSVDDNGNCLYRGPDNTMCAAGPFITDYEVEEREGYNWVESLVKVNIKPTKKDIFIERLQSCHDKASCSVFFIVDYKRYMEILAEKYDLVFNGDL